VTAIPEDLGRLRPERASRLTAIAPATGDRLLTASDVAELLAVPERWVREHTRGGLIPHVRLGRYVRYRHDAVVGWISEHEHSGAASRKHRPRVPRTSEPQEGNGKLG
jgi:excisionase family DNA binding protein